MTTKTKLKRALTTDELKTLRSRTRVNLFSLLAKTDDKFDVEKATDLIVEFVYKNRRLLTMKEFHAILKEATQ